MTETLMPGGGVARRPLHFIVMADCSGSMKGEKIQSLNYALRAMLPHLVAWERDQVQAQLLVRILGFATVPRWHVRDPLPVADVLAGWQNLEYVHQGRTNIGPAFGVTAGVLGPDRLERRALRPALLLITDGLPTDPPGGFEAGLAELLSTPAGRSALRVGVAIGRDANSEPLNRFRSPGTPILVADSTDDIVERLVAASIAVSRLSEAGADAEALAQTLMQPAAGPGPGSDDDSIL
ncbi:MAG TPA: vWA domain-containing protein [Streptosporangiaceae bacterium]